MRCSYKKEDVTVLLKDITGLVAPQPAEERERLIQKGKHYCEMIPMEYTPSEKYMEAYRAALKNFSSQTAHAVGVVAEKILKEKGDQVVLVSLARAGTPVGILIKRYLYKKYSICAPHYTISIIRGRGIDENALRYIRERHKAEDIQFVDGWIGKGAICTELEKNLTGYPGVSPQLAVLSDPAGLTELCGTHEDILIPSSCLNCTVSGLISRTFLRDDMIGKNDFHGAVYYGELIDKDLSEEFLSTIEEKFSFQDSIGRPNEKALLFTGLDEVRQIAQDFSVADINMIKPGLGEATRVLLRRIPWRILVRESDRKNPMLNHLLHLAEEKKVPVLSYPLKNYRACGIIKELSDL